MNKFKDGHIRIGVTVEQGVSKRCRLSWLTNGALVYEPKCGGEGGGVCRVSANEYSCAHGAQFGYITQYLTYAVECGMWMQGYVKELYEMSK
jgi:hypothetical protein